MKIKDNNFPSNMIFEKPFKSQYKVFDLLKGVVL